MKDDAAAPPKSWEERSGGELVRTPGPRRSLKAGLCFSAFFKKPAGQESELQDWRPRLVNQTVQLSHRLRRRPTRGPSGTPTARDGLPWQRDLHNPRTYTYIQPATSKSLQHLAWHAFAKRSRHAWFDEYGDGLAKHCSLLFVLLAQSCQLCLVCCLVCGATSALFC